MTSDIDRVLHFHKPVKQPPGTIDEFHEWNVAFALDKFHNRRSNDDVLAFFNFQRQEGITILETRCDSSESKYRVQRMVRGVCMQPNSGVLMVSSVAEVWVATSSSPEDIQEYGGEVRFMPGREDALMVSTFAADKSWRVTRWVVKLKPDPSKNIVLARDDMDPSEGKMAGNNWGFFEPVQQELP